MWIGLPLILPLYEFGRGGFAIRPVWEAAGQRVACASLMAYRSAGVAVLLQCLARLIIDEFSVRACCARREKTFSGCLIGG